MHKISLSLFLTVLSAVFFTACSKEDTTADGSNGSSTTTTLPQDTVTSFMVYFTTDSTTEVGSYDDPDGPGPKPANVGGVYLKSNSTYKVTFFIEDATDPNKVVYLHNKIKNNGSDYKICTSNPLGSSVVAVDSDGTYPIGLVNDLLTTGNTGTENMNFTIKYQKSVKNGQCSPGVTYFTCNIPFGLN